MMEEGKEGERKVEEAFDFQPLPEGRSGAIIQGWIIEAHKKPILKSSAVRDWEENLGISHLPEMIFGDSGLVLLHPRTGMKVFFNACDALKGWKQEGLPPVEVPAAAKWKFRSKPNQEVILDYDYTFTTPYCGSEAIEPPVDKIELASVSANGGKKLHWEECSERIDVLALAAKEPILFFDEVVLYEDELADNGVSLLTVKVRVMPSCWFLLLRYWLRVDGVLMRLRDTRIYCPFQGDEKAVPTVLRECCWRESTFQALAAGGFRSDSASYSDPNAICNRLPIVMQKTQKLILSP